MFGCKSWDGAYCNSNMGSKLIKYYFYTNFLSINTVKTAEVPFLLTAKLTNHLTLNLITNYTSRIVNQILIIDLSMNHLKLNI